MTSSRARSAPVPPVHDIGAEIMARADALAAISEQADGLTRRYLSPEHARANALVAKWMQDAGMTARIDAVGNVVGRYEGLGADAPALFLGSHLDTVADAGRYDGMLGVITAISCIGALHRSGERFDFAIEVLGFGDEEGLRYQSTLLGSRAVAGNFDPALLARCDQNGVSMADAMRAFGLDPDAVGDAARKPAEVLGYVELHIEQGPVLEKRGRPVGAVTAIAGATRLAVTVTGEAGHAGTVPMDSRRDALTAAAEVVLAVEALCSGKPGVVGTVGVLDVLPGASNVIPGKATLSIDIRAGENAQRLQAVDDVRKAVAGIAGKRGVAIDVQQTHESQSSPCALWLIRQIVAAIGEDDAVCLPSGAGHDAAAMAALSDVGMIFVRCTGGISHNPAESISEADAQAGADTLIRFIQNFKVED